MPTTAGQRLLDAIKQFKTQHGFAPSVRDLATDVGLAISTVHHHIAALEREGLVTREPNLPRTLVVVERPEDPNAQPLEDLPQPDPGGPVPPA